MDLLKPPKLQPGDTVAAISLSSGLAAKFPNRYEVGKRQLEKTFDLTLTPTPNALRDDDWLYRNPEARADDLHCALTHPEVKGIFSTIGGYESVRVLPFLDVALVRQYPKVFMGFSDSTTILTFFLNAGVIAFHGPSILTGFAENGGMFPYEVESIRKTLFRAEPVGPLSPAPEWTEAFLDWGKPELQARVRPRTPNPGWVWLQGEARAEGRLVGGSIEVLEMLKGARWWPSPEVWEGAILYLETSEEVPPVANVEYWLRNYGSQGILQEAAGLLFARPMRYTPEMTGGLYAAIKKVLWEVGREDMPVVANLDIGHTSPMMVLPNGVRAAVDLERRSVEVLEAGVS